MGPGLRRDDAAIPTQLSHHADLAEIFRDAGMDQIRLRRRGDRVRRGRLAGLRQFLAEGRFRAMQRFRESIGNIIRQAVAHQNKTPGTDRVDRGVLVWIGAGRHRQRLEEAVLGADTRDLIGVGRDEARTAGAGCDRRKAGPADAGAPECRDAAIEHHRRRGRDRPI